MQPLSPAAELRAAASKIGDIPEKAMLSDWLQRCAADMEAHPEYTPDGWGFALDAARQINGGVA